MTDPAQLVKTAIGTSSYTYRCNEDGHQFPPPPHYADAAAAEAAAAEHLEAWHRGAQGSGSIPPGAGLNPGWRAVED